MQLGWKICPHLGMVTTDERLSKGSLSIKQILEFGSFPPGYKTGNNKTELLGEKVRLSWIISRLFEAMLMFSLSNFFLCDLIHRISPIITMILNKSYLVQNRIMNISASNGYISEVSLTVMSMELDLFIQYAFIVLRPGLVKNIE